MAGWKSARRGTGSRCGTGWHSSPRIISGRETASTWKGGSNTIRSSATALRFRRRKCTSASWSCWERRRVGRRKRRPKTSKKRRRPAREQRRTAGDERARSSIGSADVPEIAMERELKPPLAAVYAADGIDAEQIPEERDARTDTGAQAVRPDHVPLR